MHLHITAIEVALPDGWTLWDPLGGPDEEDRLLPTAGTDPTARQRGLDELRRTVRSLEPGIRYAAVAAWLPGSSPGHRTVRATVVVEHLAGTRATPDPVDDHLRRVQRVIAYRARRGDVVYHGAEVTQVAGRSAVRSRRSLLDHEEVLYTVFPAGSRDAVELRVGAADDDGLALAEEQVPALAAGIDVHLGPA